MRTIPLILLLSVLAAGAARAAGPVASTYTVVQSSTADGACQEGTSKCATPAWQQDLAKVQSSWGACQNDVDTLCEGVQVGSGRIEKCLKAHRKKLSKGCKAQLSE